VNIKTEHRRTGFEDSRRMEMSDDPVQHEGGGGRLWSVQICKSYLKILVLPLGKHTTLFFKEICYW
jgi:hypothetical protein